MEAKAHTGELISDCQASDDGGLPLIRATLADLKRKLGVTEEHDWLKRYYQFANRLAVLNFLVRNNESARLLLIYFVGDKRPDGISSPQSEGAWEQALADQSNWLGLEKEHALFSRIHKLFVPTVM